MKFNLVNSEGATIFEEAVVSTPKGALQRAAMDGVYTLHFALKEGVTVADIKKGSIISQDDALAVVCGKAATAFEYKAGLENAADITQGKTTDNYKVKVMLQILLQIPMPLLKHSLLSWRVFQILLCHWMKT